MRQEALLLVWDWKSSGRQEKMSGYEVSSGSYTDQIRGTEREGHLFLKTAPS